MAKGKEGRGQTQAHPKNQLTDEQYDGQTCPYCKEEGTVVTDESFEAGTGDGSQVVRCTECGKRWVDVYKLTGYLDLTDFSTVT